jgi:tRNA pseudouridine38-40 synthase
MRHIKLTIQYDGTDYSGWQIQDKDSTVQGAVEKAATVIAGERIRVTGASRTDAGVHAVEQVSSFKTRSTLETNVFKRALNGNLPEDIRIIEVTECREDFHPRYSARSKVYSYLITHSAYYSVFLKRYSWQVPFDLSKHVEAIREASGYIVGEHNFSSFRASGCASKNAIREIMSIEVSDRPSIDFMSFNLKVPVIKISIRANAFLRYMVRNIVGTLMEVGRGKISPPDMEAILRSRDRGSAGKTAPAKGLFLEKIYY